MHHFPEEGSYQEFIEKCLLKNEPCLFGKWATSNWGARKRWVRSDGTPNFTSLVEQFGHVKVPVADCTQCHFSTHPKSEMLLTEYVRYWQAHIADTASHKSCDSAKLLYLKDWHLVLQFPDDASEVYSCPIFMRSDWLNEVWAARQDVEDDYKFVYMGPVGTWTPFHADVLRSYSWSANVTGSKEWLLFPPTEENKLRDKLGNLPFDVTCDEVQEKITSGNATPPLRVVQGPGEIIFVPSGWHHQVRNLEHTISINHNWSNAFSLQNMWRHLQQEMSLVRQELQDCVDMEGWQAHCQVVLKACAGMDYWEFAQLLMTIAKPRVQHLKELVRRDCSSQCVVMTDTFTASLEHFITAVMSDQSKLSFFKGDFTSELVPDELSKCLQPNQTFHQLVQALPGELRQVVDSVKCKGQHKHSVVVFRAFEVYILSAVAQQVNVLTPCSF